jgi:hypothetical protein
MYEEKVIRLHWALRLLGVVWVVGGGGAILVLLLSMDDPPWTIYAIIPIAIVTVVGVLCMLLGTSLNLERDGFRLKVFVGDKGTAYRWCDIGPVKVVAGIIIAFDGEPVARSVFAARSTSSSRRMYGADNAFIAWQFGAPQRIAEVLNRGRHGV